MKQSLDMSNRSPRPTRHRPQLGAGSPIASHQTVIAGDASTVPGAVVPAASDAEERSRTFPIPRTLWPLSAVLVTYAFATLVVPTLTPVAISDDWTYTRSVEILIREGRFHILSVAAATQVFQLVWGGLFAFTFGLSFGVLRLSTVVLIFLSGIAFYGLCRELGIGRERSALGTAVYLFNPILFAITYSFMSDPHFLALLVIATFGYVRGLRPGLEGERATALASIVSALACLQRPHGALIPLGVVTWLVLTRRLRLDRPSRAPFLRIVAIPAVTFLGYYLFVSRGLPSQQGYFLGEAKAAGFDETWLLVRRLTVIEMMYIGLFVAPIVTAALPSLRRLTALKLGRTWLIAVAWWGILIAGLAWFWGEGRRMPYIPHFLGKGGPGSGDLRAARPPLFGAWAYNLLTLGCAAVSLLFVLFLVRALDRGGRPGRAGAGMALVIAGWQIVGVVPQSLLFRDWIVSLDRYLLPLLPFAICLLLWALNDSGMVSALAWGITALMALFSIAGTRDVLVFQNQVWSLAKGLNAEGIPNTRIDAGYAWDAYHLWEYSEEYQIAPQTPDGTWWTDVYAKATDSTFVIAGAPLPGYEVLSVHPYSAWLQRQHVALLVERRHPFTQPPTEGFRRPPTASFHGANVPGKAPHPAATPKS